MEGGNINNWSQWEKENAKWLTKKAGKYWENWQKKKFPEMFEEKNYISSRTCDHYHRFNEDFDLAKEMGHNAHRFSVEWSRIEPQKGKIDEKEIEHYREVVLALKKRGLEPFITLYHWTLPLWLSDAGGWLNPRSPYYFDRFVKIISEKLFDQVNFWITINEPNVYASNSYLRGVWPPQKKSFFKYFKVLNNLAEAHRLAYKSLHLIDLDCSVGISKNNVFFEKSFLYDYFWNKYFLKKISGKQDFIGLNYYFHHSFFKKRKLPKTDMGRGYYPKGIYHLLKDLKKYKKPIYITENGLADKDDKQREKFIKEHLFWVYKAIKEGVDVGGYLYWSLLDNFEWDKGFWPRFGLIEVDYKTFERRVRKSALSYAEICKRNAIEE